MAWQVDTSHTHISFVARHMMITKVRGEFTNDTWPHERLHIWDIEPRPKLT